MMKKGTIQLIVTVVFTLIFVVLVLKVTAGFVKPLFWNDKNSVSYENFKILTDNVNNLINTPTTTSMRQITLQIEPKFKIIGFEAPSETKICYHNFFKDTPIIGQSYDKPYECKLGKNCLCLFKEDEVVECKNFEKTIFYSQYGERSLVPESQGCEKKTHPKSKYKYEEIVFNGNLKVPVLKLSPKNVYWGAQQMYIENYKKNNENHILISPLNNELLKRFKMISNCPKESSDKGCNNYQHYDEVIEETIDNDLKTFVCKFNEEKNKCEKKEIENCIPGLIEEECACGDTAYNVGTCVDKDWYSGDIPTDYCFAHDFDETSTCANYKTTVTGVLTNPDDQYACTFNVCGVKTNCYWNSGSCETCDNSGSCKDYKEGWVRFVDSCDYDKDNLFPDTNDCVDCKKITTCEEYPSPETCGNDQCELVGACDGADCTKQRGCFFNTGKCTTQYITCQNECNFYNAAACNLIMQSGLNSNTKTPCDLHCAPETKSPFGCYDCDKQDCNSYDTAQKCLDDPCKLWRAKDNKKCEPEFDSNNQFLSCNSQTI